MSLSGDYLIPRLAGYAFLEKPPLYYAVAAPFYTLMGDLFEEAGRMASLVFALGTLIAVHLTARRIWSSQEAILAPLILATFPLFYLASHKILVDMGLTFFVTAAMCSFLVAFKEKSTCLFRAFWVFMAGAFLCKGFVGLAIPGTALLMFMLWQRDTGFLRQAWLIKGITLITLIMAAWAAVLYARGGSGYLYSFYVYNQIGRFITMGTMYEGGHVRPLYFYVKTIFLLTAPFSLLLVPAAAKARELKDLHRFLYSWVLGGLLILSIASTKREIYFLPMLPAMALIIAQWAGTLGEDCARAWEGKFLKANILTILTVAVALPVVYVKVGGSVVTAALVSMVLFSFFLMLWKRSPWTHPLSAVLCWSLMFILWAPAAFPQVDKMKSYKGMFEEMGRIAAQRQAMGYQLTETVEALGPFYGHFPVRNIEDKALFIEALHKHEAEYVIVLPTRMEGGLSRELAAHARQVYLGGGKTRREIELWKMHLSR